MSKPIEARRGTLSYCSTLSEDSRVKIAGEAVWSLYGKTPSGDRGVPEGGDRHTGYCSYLTKF